MKSRTQLRKQNARRRETLKKRKRVEEEVAACVAAFEADEEAEKQKLQMMLAQKREAALKKRAETLKKKAEEAEINAMVLAEAAGFESDMKEFQRLNRVVLSEEQKAVIAHNKAQALERLAKTKHKKQMKLVSGQIKKLKAVAVRHPSELILSDVRQDQVFPKTVAQYGSRFRIPAGVTYSRYYVNRKPLSDVKRKVYADIERQKAEAEYMGLYRPNLYKQPY